MMSFGLEGEETLARTYVWESEVAVDAVPNIASWIPETELDAVALSNGSYR